MVSIGKHYRQKPLRFQTFQEGIEVLASLAEVFVKFILQGNWFSGKFSDTILLSFDYQIIRMLWKGEAPAEKARKTIV